MFYFIKSNILFYKINIRRMTEYNFSKLWLIWKFLNKVMYRDLSLDIFWHSITRVTEKREMFAIVYELWNSGTFWTQKIIQEKSTKFIKILNYIKSSCITFCVQMFRYSEYIHCLQEISTDFGLQVLINFGLKVLKHFRPKNHRGKIDKIHKDF